LLGSLLPDLHSRAAPLLDAGLVWKFELGSYDREVERYGGPEAIEIAEQFFSADSDAVISFLDGLQLDEQPAESRWQFALCGVDLMLDDLGLDLEGKLEAMTLALTGLSREFGITQTTRRQLGKKFRERSSLIADLLAGRADVFTTSVERGIQALALRSHRQLILSKRIQALHAARCMSTSPLEFALHLVHMHLNRVLATCARPQEVVIYDLLRRHYASLLGRIRTAGTLSHAVERRPCPSEPLARQ
jgi:thiopeptide-type bacteriocin biosynthesis protein